jgi:hypothetical protein
MSSYGTDDHTPTPAEASDFGRFAAQPLEPDPEVLLVNTLNSSCFLTEGGWVKQEPIRFCEDMNLHQMVWHC